MDMEITFEIAVNGYIVKWVDDETHEYQALVYVEMEDAIDALQEIATGKSH